ncbi:hypothetical protein V7127_04495 [Bacillus sp. JJ1773]|uniref:hypothetical protein n=1 Tax=Bacillus sp. JJ1773 TaxID=3122965 RepID=UPI002FFF1887
MNWSSKYWCICRNLEGDGYVGVGRRSYFTSGFHKKRPLIIVGSGLSISWGIRGMGELLNRLTEKLPVLLNEEELIKWNACLEIIKMKGFEEGL